MSDATFARPDLTAFARLDELGLEVVGQRVDPDRAVLACRVVEPDQWCRRCGCQGAPRDTVTRRLAHEPLGWRPTTLLVTVRRYRCTGCGHVWRQDTSSAAAPRAKLSRRGLRWALEAIVCQHLTVARVAEGLAVSWNTANDAVLAEGRRVLVEDPGRFDGVRVIGVDEHVWRHTRRGDTYIITVIIDLTPIRCGSGPARLLDMIEGRSKQAFKQWLAERPQAWRSGVEVVAMDGFTGFKTAAAEELPDAVAVMDPFHVVRLAGDALDQPVYLDNHQERGRRTHVRAAERRDGRASATACRPWGEAGPLDRATSGAAGLPLSPNPTADFAGADGEDLPAMTRYHGRHRKATTTGRTVAKVAVTGMVAGAPPHRARRTRLGGHRRAVGCRRPVRERRQLRHQHRQRLLR